MASCTVSKKKELGLTFSKTKMWQENSKKAYSVLCSSKTLGIPRRNQFATGQCSSTFCLYLCLIIWTKCTQTGGWGELNPFNGISTHRIWHPVTIIRGIFEIRCILWASQRNYWAKEKDLTGTSKNWQRYFIKVCKNMGRCSCFVLREAVGHFKHLLKRIIQILLVKHASMSPSQTTESFQNQSFKRLAIFMNTLLFRNVHH